MSRRTENERWPFNVTVKCAKCGRTLLRYRAWRDGDREGVDGEERWEPADAEIINVGRGGKFIFTCTCRARPQVRYSTVADAATPSRRNTLNI